MLKSPLGDIIWKSHRGHGAIFGGKVTVSKNQKEQLRNTVISLNYTILKHGQNLIIQMMTLKSLCRMARSIKLNYKDGMI
jgi:hypothetical protein